MDEKKKEQHEESKRFPLGHELGARSPCLKCGDKCPGLALHYWKKICKYCQCKQDDHDVRIEGNDHGRMIGSFSKHSSQQPRDINKKTEPPTKLNRLTPDTPGKEDVLNIPQGTSEGLQPEQPVKEELAKKDESLVQQKAPPPSEEGDDAPFLTTEGADDEKQPEQPVKEELAKKDESLVQQKAPPPSEEGGDAPFLTTEEADDEKQPEQPVKEELAKKDESLVQQKAPPPPEEGGNAPSPPTEEADDEKISGRLGSGKVQVEANLQRQQPKRVVKIKVILLDATAMELNVNRRVKGQDMIDSIYHELELIETDYFGVLYKDPQDSQEAMNWIDPLKRVGKQLGGGPWIFYFNVKFYPPDPSQLKEDITRYQLCLQLRQDIQNGKVPCPQEKLALLGSYVVQSELGDHDPEKHGNDSAHLEPFNFAPSGTSPEDQKRLEENVLESHKTHKGQTPAEADLYFLENAKKLAMYGVDLHYARDAEGVDTMVGVCQIGLLVYQDELKNRYAWPKILKISYKRNKFYMKLQPLEFERFGSTVRFKLVSYRAAKRLWKSSVEHYTFFRLVTPERPRTLWRLIHLGSNFRYSSRTLHQTRVATATIDRNNPSFKRHAPSTNRETRSLDGYCGSSERPRSVNVEVNFMSYADLQDDKPHQLNDGPNDEKVELSADDSNITKETAVTTTTITKTFARDQDNNETGDSKNEMMKPQDYIMELKVTQLSYYNKMHSIVSSLRVALGSNPISWVQQFGDEGLNMLLQVLRDFSERDDLTSSEIRHECIQCLTAFMNSNYGIQTVLSKERALVSVASALDPAHPDMMIDTMQLLAALCFLPPNGPKRVLNAITAVAEKKNLPRFSPIIEALKQENTPQGPQLMNTSMQLINALIKNVDYLDSRLHLKSELFELGMLEILPELQDIEREDFKIQMRVFEKFKDDDAEELHQGLEGFKVERDCSPSMCRTEEENVTQTKVDPEIVIRRL